MLCLKRMAVTDLLTTTLWHCSPCFLVLSIFKCVCGGEGLVYVSPEAFEGQKENFRCPEVGDGCKSLDMSARKQSRVLCRGNSLV